METTELCTQRSAQELLAEFKATGRQEPFEEIVRRYAGMVYHVCLQVTKNSHDAEDVTQAVFLTLAVQAKTSKEIRCLGPWLQQVGHRLALDLRKSKKRRQAREEKHSLIRQYINPCYEQPTPLDQEEMRYIINEEMNKLPAKYRLPLILYYFGGLSRDAMAAELHLKAGTLGARLHRGRAMLGSRLAERGVLLAEGSLSVVLAHSVQATITDALIANTCQAATQYVACGDLNIGVLPIQVVGLVKNAVRAAILAKVKTLAVVLLVAGTAVAAGAEAVARARPLDLHLNLPSELGDRVLPLLQPIPIPKFSDATPKTPQLSAPKSDDTLLANHTTRGLSQESGSPGFSTDNTGTGPAGWGGSAGLGSWTATFNHGPLPYAYGGLNKGDKPAAAAMHGSVLQGSLLNSTGIGISTNSWVANGLAPHRIGGDNVPRPAAHPQNAGMAMVPARQAPRALVSGGAGADSQPGQGKSNPSDSWAKFPQNIPGESEPIIHPYEPPVVQNPTPNIPPGVPGGPVQNTPPVAVVPPTAPPPMASNDSRMNVVIYPKHLGQLTESSPPTSQTGPLASSDSGGTTTAWTYSSQYPLGMENYLNFNAGETAFPYVLMESGARAMITTDTVRGYGKATPVGSFDQNGQVIADGHGEHRTLDLSAVSAIENRIDNPVQQGTNGWYATRKGKLTLPPLDVTQGTATYTWGESDSDPSIDLVNSVRLRMTDVAHETPVTISLVALDSAGENGVPALPGGHTFLALWEFNAPDLEAGRIDLTVRYDDNLAREKGLNELSIKMWRFADGSWEIIQPFPQDRARHLLTGHTDSLTYFAVSSPEPGGMLIFATSVLLLSRRRRRS